MEEELMFSIDALRPHTPVARVYGNNNEVRCSISLSQSIHLWHIDLVLAAYRLYWTAKGLRSEKLNLEDGITFTPAGGTVDPAEDMYSISKRLIDSVCRNGRYDQPNLLRKINDGRFVLLNRDKKKKLEVYVTGGYETPVFFVRRIGSGEVLQNFTTFPAAMSFSE